MSTTCPTTSNMYLRTKTKRTHRNAAEFQRDSVAVPMLMSRLHIGPILVMELPVAHWTGTMGQAPFRPKSWAHALAHRQAPTTAADKPEAFLAGLATASLESPPEICMQSLRLCCRIGRRVEFLAFFFWLIDVVESIG